jgi:hypothetical protein
MVCRLHVVDRQSTCSFALAIHSSWTLTPHRILCWVVHAPTTIVIVDHESPLRMVRVRLQRADLDHCDFRVARSFSPVRVHISLAWQLPKYHLRIFAYILAGHDCRGSGTCDRVECAPL